MLTLAGVNGIFRCSKESCKLEGDTTSGIVTVNMPSEFISLSGTGSSLKGGLGVKGTDNIYELVADAPN
jgi:hypothetical protein